MSPEEKSKIRRSPAYSQEPSARVMTTCLMPPCADHATRTWSPVSLATVDASVGRFVATAIAPSLDREKERPPGPTRRSFGLLGTAQLPPAVTCTVAFLKLAPVTSAPDAFSASAAFFARSVRYAPSVGLFFSTWYVVEMFTV